MQTKIIMELHPLEANLIKLIRNRFQWGEITIECRDGLPQRMGKAFVWEKIPSTDMVTVPPPEENLSTEE